MIMVSEQRTQLLGHPLCMALVRNKWNSLGGDSIEKFRFGF